MAGRDAIKEDSKQFTEDQMRWIILFWWLVMSGCVFTRASRVYSVDRTIVAELPFAPDDPAKCTWAGSNMVVLDTPDGEDDGEVYAPVGGTVYRFVDDRDGALGSYVKLDQGDGTYVLVAHLHRVRVSSHQRIQAGTLIGNEGIEGTHNGHDVMIARFAGNAQQPDVPHEALSSMELRVIKRDASVQSVRVDALNCDRVTGDVYRSAFHWSVRPSDDLAEGRDWVRVYGENLWIQPSAHQERWFVFPEGEYHIVLSGSAFLDATAQSCDQAPSVLCRRDPSGSWALSFTSGDGQIISAP